VGSNTVIKDDPFLLDGKKRGYDVSRVIVDTRLKMPADSNLIKTTDKAPVLIGTTELAPRSRVEDFRRIKGVEVVITKSKKGKVSMKSFLRALARRNIVNVLVEGGGELVGNLMDESLVDEVMFFISPKIIGGSYSSVKGDGAKNIAEALELRDMEVKGFGSDIFIRGLMCLRG
jgi:diaminohydroxyphosphoribosylaminopyrimidine deaminase/5-amino-6-(5-phosphoribosylamino)uracil reductase